MGKQPSYSEASLDVKAGNVATAWQAPLPGAQCAAEKFRADGYLSLNFRPTPRDNDPAAHVPHAAAPCQTIVDIQGQNPPLRMIRAFALPDGAALAHLHNVSGGVLGGDRLRVDLVLQPHAQAQVTTTGATRVYRQRTGYPDAQQTTTIHVSDGALLEYLPDTLIPFAGARYCQRTHVHLGHDAGLVMWELLAPGRDARGERFAYDRLDLQLTIDAVDQSADEPVARPVAHPIARERYCLEPALRPLTSPARLGDYRYVATLYLCRVGVASERWLELEKAVNAHAATFPRDGGAVWGASTLPAHGLVIRGLGHTTHALASRLVEFWQLGKQALYGRAAIPPRKVP